MNDSTPSIVDNLAECGRILRDLLPDMKSRIEQTDGTSELIGRVTEMIEQLLSYEIDGLDDETADTLLQEALTVQVRCMEGLRKLQQAEWHLTQLLKAAPFQGTPSRPEP